MPTEVADAGRTHRTAARPPSDAGVWGGALVIGPGGGMIPNLGWVVLRGDPPAGPRFVLLTHRWDGTVTATARTGCGVGPDAGAAVSDLLRGARLPVPGRPGGET